MPHFASSLFVLLTSAASASAGDRYIVVDLVGPNDPYYAAAECVAKLRGGEIVSSDLQHFPDLLETLRAKQPHYVAVVVRPDDLDVNLARRFLKLSTEIDEDPFVDFAYGFITGDTPETALSLARRGFDAERNRREPTIAVAGVGEKAIMRSAVSQQQFPLRKATLPQLWGQIAGGQNFNDGRDAKFIQKLMPQLAGKSMIVFAGHGYPREVVGGPTWKDLDGLRFDGAVVLNIACLTGVTNRWFEEDWKANVKRERTVPRDESFCLATLRTGAVAYVAYTCPRPAGPELFGDFAALAAEGPKRRRGPPPRLQPRRVGLPGGTARPLEDHSGGRRTADSTAARSGARLIARHGDRRNRVWRSQVHAVRRAA